MLSYKLKFLLLVALSITYIYASNITTNEYYIQYNNQQIHLKEKRLATNNKHAKPKVVVLVNPLSIPALVAFDVPSYSLMDALANLGYDVWGIDFIGQGKSSYYPVMELSPAPIGQYPLQAPEALKQLSSGINYILETTGTSRVFILGWSWGSVVAAMYAIQSPNKVERLVLYGAMYSSGLESSIKPIFITPFAAAENKFSEKLPAYQNIPWEVIHKHWNMMINGDKSIVTQSAVKQVAKAYVNADIKSAQPNSLRRVMGPMKDLYSIWNGRPVYDINQLHTPTLVIYGDQDFFADRGLYASLHNVKIKQEVKLRNATHWLIYEKTRQQFVDTVDKFFNDKQ